MLIIEHHHSRRNSKHRSYHKTTDRENRATVQTNTMIGHVVLLQLIVSVAVQARLMDVQELFRRSTVTGKYTNVPSFEEIYTPVLIIPNAATNVVIKNNDEKNAMMIIGYVKTRTNGKKTYRHSYFERECQGSTCQHTDTLKEVDFAYQRHSSYSEFKISGPVQPKSGYQIAFYVSTSGNGNTGNADIEWEYE